MIRRLWVRNPLGPVCCVLELIMLIDALFPNAVLNPGINGKLLGPGADSPSRKTSP